MTIHTSVLFNQSSNKPQLMLNGSTITTTRYITSIRKSPTFAHPIILIS